MARIAFVLDRVFRKFGLSGKSFIPMLIGVGCGVPGIMASRTIENERDRRMTDYDHHLHPLRRQGPLHRHDRRRHLRRQRMGLHLRLLHRHGRHHRLRHHAEEDQDVRRRSRSLRDGAARLPLAHSGQRAALACGSAAGASSRRPAPSSCCPPSSCGSPPTSAGWTAPSGCWPRSEIDSSILAAIGGAIAWIFKPLGWGNWQAAVASITGLVAKENIVGTLGILYGGGDGTVYQNIGAAFTGISGYQLPGVQPAVRSLLRRHRRHQAGDEQPPSGPGSPSAISAASPMSSA